jgi:hypothetical protein
MSMVRITTPTRMSSMDRREGRLLQMSCRRRRSVGKHGTFNIEWYNERA